ncbi:OmpA family protein [Mangrovicoccus sp. HB182678]|uniref:OmpA family protein n=2 Tax=Mangrovicoccus algicola TaxID=2771008 RepID=A0A8J7CMI6_9RHOB|nr:OmpA family protein [Mangrovicoccus algicola]
MLAALLAISGPAIGQEDPFAGGWVLDAPDSSLAFQSIKTLADGTVKVESNGFAGLAGGIDPDGTARLRVLLDSVDTGIDLRNVRMRFLFFETFRFPEAVAQLKLDPAMVAGLPDSRRSTLTLPFTLSMHGATVPLEARLALTHLDGDRVSVASLEPVSVPAAAFGLDANVGKLEEAVGGISIVPTATVSFDLQFRRGPQTGPSAPDPAAPGPDGVALEAAGDFPVEACIGRFEILSRTGNIHFAPGSAALDPDSLPLLASLLDIVRRCPGMRVEIGGHTDSDGSWAANQALSEARAQAVMDHLLAEGIAPEQLAARGYGETRPLVANDGAANKARNRRIGFIAQPR